MMEKEVNEKVVGIMIQSGESAGKVFYRGLRDFSESMKRGKRSTIHYNKEKTGKVSMRDLTKDGSQIELLDLQEVGLKEFQRHARKYNVKYAVQKDKGTDPPTYCIFFKARDGELINRSISDFLKASMEREKRKDGVREKLEKFAEIVSGQKRKTRNKEQVR